MWERERKRERLERTSVCRKLSIVYSHSPKEERYIYHLVWIIKFPKRLSFTPY
jgi:hypothetical protein